MNRGSNLGIAMAIAALAGSGGNCQGPQRSSVTPRPEPAGNLRPERTLRAHAGGVHGLAYSRDGRLLASAGEDGRVRLWTTGAARCVLTLRAPTDCVAFSPNGRWLATANYEPDIEPDTFDRPYARLVKVWNVRSGQLVHELSGHRAPVTSVAWSPNGALLASASDDGSVKLWRTRTWRVAATLDEPFSHREKGDHVNARQVLFAPDGRTLGVVSVDLYQGQPGDVTTHVALWNTDTWKRRRLLLEERVCVNALVAFTPDSRRLVAATEGFPSDGSVYAWDLPNGRKKVLAEGEEASYAAALIPPGRWFVAGGKEATAFLLDLRNGEIVAGLPHTSEVMAMAPAPDGRTLATGDAHGILRFWPMPPPGPRPVRRSGLRAAASKRR